MSSFKDIIKKIFLVKIFWGKISNHHEHWHTSLKKISLSFKQGSSLLFVSSFFETWPHWRFSSDQKIEKEITQIRNFCLRKKSNFFSFESFKISQMPKYHQASVFFMKIKLWNMSHTKWGLNTQYWDLICFISHQKKIPLNSIQAYAVNYFRISISLFKNLNFLWFYWSSKNVF